jgi:MFS family permease
MLHKEKIMQTRSSLLPASLSTGMPAFSIIWIGQLVSLIGSAMTRFAIGIWLFEQTGLATTFTTMVFFSNIPRIVLSPFAGALVDRWNRKFTMMASDLGSVATTIIIFLLLSGGSLSIWHIYALAALSSAFESFQFPAYSSAITMMVDKKHFARTSAMLSLAQDSSRVIAPILAAMLIGVIQLEGIILIDLITFSAAIGTLLLIPIPQPKQSETGKKAQSSFWREVTFGFRYIFSSPSLLGLQINFLMVNVMLGLSTTLRTPMILARTGNDEVTLGITTSIALAGGVVGGIIMTAWGGPKRRIHGVLFGIMLLAFAVGVLGLGHEIIGWSIGGFLIFLFLPLTNSSNQAIWQSKTPADVQGKVFAARRVTGQITFPLAALLTGPLADRLFEPALAVNGGLAPVFGGVVGTGPGAGMSLVMLLTAFMGLILPIASYFIPAIRNVEDIIPDIQVSAADAPAAEPTNNDSGKPKTSGG